MKMKNCPFCGGPFEQKPEYNYGCHNPKCLFQPRYQDPVGGMFKLPSDKNREGDIFEIWNHRQRE